MVFELARLPPEVRQLIWDATLPGQRIFHVSELAAAPDSLFKTDHNKDDRRREQTLDFHIRHPPPMAHRVCRESRAVMLLRGFFLGRAWFNPHRDMLYLDRNMRHRLATRASGLERVLHVGLEWRAWFRDVPRTDDCKDARRRWQAALEPLLLRHCPRAETVSFVLPRVRHVGGVPSGRESYGAERHVCHLEELLDGVQVPWERAPVAVAGGALVLGDPGTALAQIGGGSANVEWGVIRRQMEAAVGELQHERSGREVRVKGWWLVRPGVRMGDEDGEVREFSS